MFLMSRLSPDSSRALSGRSEKWVGRTSEGRVQCTAYRMFGAGPGPAAQHVESLALALAAINEQAYYPVIKCS